MQAQVNCTVEVRSIRIQQGLSRGAECIVECSVYPFNRVEPSRPAKLSLKFDLPPETAKLIEGSLQEQIGLVIKLQNAGINPEEETPSEDLQVHPRPGEEDTDFDTP